MKSSWLLERPSLYPDFSNQKWSGETSNKSFKKNDLVLYFLLTISFVVLLKIMKVVLTNKINKMSRAEDGIHLWIDGQI